jgi:hypothetical protein
MSKTISFACALALGAIGPFTLQPGTASAVPVAGDLDGDLSGAADCAPLDPSVHPDAPDRPDLAFTDTNCDGVDGDAAKAVFVSTVDGSDAGTGTRLNPFKTIQAGINAAAPGGRDVYIAGGTYAESLALADDVSLYGGYEREFLHRSPAEVTKIAGPGGPAALAAGDTGVVLQQLTLQGRPDVSGNSYGLRAIPDGAVASQVVLEEVTSTADAAGAAINGFSGGTGLTGFGLAGGAGGAGGCNTVGSPGFLGSGSGVGSPGANGANGTVIAQSGPSWLRQSASNGGTGAPGAGGRGGTGGTGDNNFGIAVCGGRGGTGGFGGGGGGGGGGGVGGAGSFGVFAFNSSVVAVRSTLAAGSGGAGGNGGTGGPGGLGGSGLAGLAGDCLTVFVTVCGAPGQAGEPGLRGGPGGGGGGGVGGPSAAVYQGGASSGFTSDEATVTTPGTAGLGGFAAVTGTRAPSGVSVSVLRAGGGPTSSTFDFDGDTVLDPADQCPADAGDVNGCPIAPETTITSGPADGGFLLSQSTKLGLASSKGGSTVACSLDGGDADACTSPHALSGLSARTHVFRAWATDAFGNADPSAVTRTFTVPVNNTALTASTGWKKKTGNGYFRDTYSTSSKKGAALSTRVTGARRIALVATKAPGQGRVNIMLGKTVLKQVNLSSATTRKKQVFEHEFGKAKSGTVKLVVATSGKPVKIEGLGVATR